MLNNIDKGYIENLLKREVTKDELQVLTDFWRNNIIPRAKKNNLRFGNNELVIKSYSNDGIESFICCINKALSTTKTADALAFSTNNLDKKYITEIGKYCNNVGIPVVNTEFKNNDYNKRFDVFSLTLSNKKVIYSNKIKNDAKIVIVEDKTDTNEKNLEIKDLSFLQKKLINLTKEAQDNKIFLAVQSCEKGLFTNITELIKNKSWGAFLNLNNLTKTDNSIPAWQYLTYKSNKQLIFIIKNSKLMNFINLLDKYELKFSIIGKIDKSKKIKITDGNKQVININKKDLFNFKKYKNEKEEFIEERNNICPRKDITEENIQQILNDTAFKSKINLFKNFNGYIGNRSSFLSYENSIAEMWYSKIKRYISYVIQSNDISMIFNPYITGQNSVCEAYRKLIAFGHKPIGIYVKINLNYDKKEDLKNIKMLEQGIEYAAKKLNIKITDIEYSNYQNTNFTIIGIGKKKKREKLFVPYFENAQKVYVIGKLNNNTSTSLYQNIIDKSPCPNPDEINFKFEKKLLKCIKFLQKKNYINTIVPIDKFGIAGAIAKALYPKNLGFKSIKNNFSLNYLFNETQSRFLISTCQDIEGLLIKRKIPFIFLGKTKTADFIEFNDKKINCEIFYKQFLNQD